MKQNKGFSLLEGVILMGVLLLIAGVGFVGWKSFTKSGLDDKQASSAASQTAEVITTKADLKAAEKALGELNFDDEEAIEAEAQASL